MRTWIEGQAVGPANASQTKTLLEMRKPVLGQAPAETMSIDPKDAEIESLRATVKLQSENHWKEHERHAIEIRAATLRSPEVMAIVEIAQKYHDEHWAELHKTDTPERATYCPVCRDIAKFRMVKP